jgi:hypothetical protein
MAPIEQSRRFTGPVAKIWRGRGRRAVVGPSGRGAPGVPWPVPRVAGGKSRTCITGICRAGANESCL